MIGEAVLEAIAAAEDRPAVLQLAVHGCRGSGKPAELLAAAKIERRSEKQHSEP